jgi:Rrf2 family iron-sulfur cluster assembly transcriptional regulator
MMLTTKGRYAVMAMVDIAHCGGSHPVNLEKISERQDIAVNYLEQIFVKLRKNGLVLSIKGPGGGYKLNDLAERITIADIIKAVNEPMEMTRCNKQHQAGCIQKKTRCLTHDLWDGLTRRIDNYLSEITIADVCNNSRVPKMNISNDL